MDVLQARNLSYVAGFPRTLCLHSSRTSVSAKFYFEPYRKVGYISQPSTHSNRKSILPATAKLDENGESISCSYDSWLVLGLKGKHPSALRNFEEMLRDAEGKEIAVFLDYDGTLSPIVDDPDQASMNDDMRAAVCEVASCFPTAIISGRRRNKVYEFVKLKNLYYAGSHGMDISTPSGSSKYEDQKHETKAFDEKGNQVVLFHPAEEFLPKIQKIVEVLKEKTTGIEGSMIEDNMFCVSVHYRRVKNEKDVGLLKGIVESIVKDNTDFQISEGKKVIGQIGRGLPIIVSSIAKETKASYSLRDPDHVMIFLKRLAKWKKNLLQ